jgi:hypothetical protein
MRTLVFSVTLLGAVLLPANPANAQSTTLQPGIPIERNLTAGQSHSFLVNLDANQFMQLVVDQRGIDVVVRVFAPQGRRLGEFDSPNGTDGPENVTVIAELAGAYRIEVAPLDPSENSQSGRYEIKIVELRKATEQELHAAQNQEVIKQKAIALLKETTASFTELRNAQTRARFQTKAARLLWSSDEKAARKLIEQAMDSLKEFIASIDPEENYFENFQAAMQQRGEIVNVLAPHDPETALNFLRSTHMPTTPEEFDDNTVRNQELELEASLVRQIATIDPKRAFEIAEDTLKLGYAATLSDCLNQLRTKDPDLAAKLAHDIVAKLLNEKLLRRTDAAYFAMNFVRTVRMPRRIQSNGGDSPKLLLSEDDYRDLLQKLLTEALSYSPPAPNSYSEERNAAQNILNMLKEIGPELDTYSPGAAATVNKRFAELNQLDPQRAAWQKFQETANNGTVDNALQAISEAPREVRDQLYAQIASRLATAGDLSRARQIINDQITNPRQRRQALRNAEQQAIYAAAGKGRVDEALRNLSAIHPAYERVRILTQIVNQIGPGLKKAAVLQLLEQARSMIGDSPVAEDQEKMAALFELASAFSRFDANRSFEIVEPLIEQFNAISEAAETLNGFGQRYYDKGELILTNGNPVNAVSNRLANTMATLAMVNFERAKESADKIHPTSPRINTYLTIAQQAIESAQRSSFGRE